MQVIEDQVKIFFKRYYLIIILSSSLILFSVVVDLAFRLGYDLKYL